MNLDNYKYRKVLVDVSVHATERANERDLTSNELGLLENHYNSFIDKLYSSGKIKIRQDYLAYSKNLNRGFVYNYDGAKTLTLITVLEEKPFVRTYPNSRLTKKLKVESVVDDSDELVKKYIHDIFEIDTLDIDREYEEVILVFDEFEYISHFIDGEIYDIEGLDFLETE